MHILGGFLLNKNRYLLCLLLSGWLIYFALPRLSFSSEGEAGYFASAWLFLAIIVILGNVVGLVYTPMQRKKMTQTLPAKEKIRSYNR